MTKEDYIRNATAIRVIDGDTIEVLIDLGFDVSRREIVRVYGINSPESNSRDEAEKKLGQAAKLQAMALIRPGDSLVLKTHKDREKYGRYLAEIVLADGRNFGQTMITLGHAAEYFGGKR